MTTATNNWKQGIEHPSDDDLLCLIDGELAADPADHVRTHLEACWPCRTRAEKVQSAISSFIEYRSRILLPMTEAPGNWSGFERRLRDAVTETTPPSTLRRWRSGIGRILGSLRNIDLRIARLTSISALTVLLLTAGLYLLFISSQTTVSAEELLTRAIATRTAELAVAGDPVVFQQLKIKRRAPERDATANVELWQDTTHGRMKEIILPVVGDAAGKSITMDLDTVMRSSGYEPPPLVVAGYQAWRNSVSVKREAVTDDRLDDGVPVLRLTTEIAATVEPGRIVSSSLTVRTADFHPVEQRFTVRTANGDETYELRETSFAVMSLNTLKPGLFDNAVSAPIVAATRPAERNESPSLTEAETRPSASVPNVNTEPVAAPRSNTFAATADLEIEVLNLLHTAGADLGEQIEVHRTANGPVTVTGVVETSERRAQILSALQPVSSNPVVRVQISTAAEEIARLKQRPAKPGASNASVENIDVDSTTFPAEADLRTRLGDDTAVKRFASRAISRSSSAMNYLWAMRRLKNQFSPGDLQKLTPEARAKLLNVIRSYARSYQNEIAGLKHELQPIFGGGSGAGDGMAINNDADLVRAIDQLFTAGSNANQIVRQAFTAGQGTSAVGTPQFWQQLGRAEAIARSVASMK